MADIPLMTLPPILVHKYHQAPSTFMRGNNDEHV